MAISRSISSRASLFRASRPDPHGDFQKHFIKGIALSGINA
jgi:hypothetical protein